MTFPKRNNATPVIEHPIIFFDGVCGMCNRFVDVVMRADKDSIFRFAPLQGETARELLPPLTEDPREWSLIYLDERGIHEQSDASLEVYRRLGGPWWLLSLGRLVPRLIRNQAYRWIASNRYRWFGRRDSCRLPTEEEKGLFFP
ncbi:MAG: DCC1-like thiol-disulfide oxidoreductase family protein [Deltaproteobacteria bacterium]|nr:DCC1-like thiol-disulfide oxidoreductase family protein [Deltaproteobacteria bacterium]